MTSRPGIYDRLCKMRPDLFMGLVAVRIQNVHDWFRTSGQKFNLSEYPGSFRSPWPMALLEWTITLGEEVPEDKIQTLLDLVPQCSRETTLPMGVLMYDGFPPEDFLSFFKLDCQLGAPSVPDGSG